jgi:hypothetical protein
MSSRTRQTDMHDFLRQTDMHDFLSLRVLLLMLHQLQLPRHIKVLSISCVCTQLNIVD